MVAGEPHEERVPAELDDVTAATGAVLDHPVEAVRDEGVHFLGAFTAASCESLRQRREPGDVGRDERSVERLPRDADGPPEQQIG
jgi:hypothetical protein